MKKLLFFNLLIQVFFFILSLLSVRIFDKEHKSLEMFSYVFYFDLIFCFFYFILNSLFLFYLKSKKNLFSNYFILLETFFPLIIFGLIIIVFYSGKNFTELIFKPYFISGILILFFSIVFSYLITKPNKIKEL
jgi:hypothetical protein